MIKGAGYLLNDNTCSGGLKYERDIWTCTHCQRVIELIKGWRGGENDVAYCRHCDKPVCGPGTACYAEFQACGCQPFVKKVEKILSNEHRVSQFRKLAGLDQPPAATGMRFHGKT